MASSQSSAASFHEGAKRGFMSREENGPFPARISSGIKKYPLDSTNTPRTFASSETRCIAPRAPIQAAVIDWLHHLLAGPSKLIIVQWECRCCCIAGTSVAFTARFREQHLELRGIKPVRESVYGLTLANDKSCARSIENMRSHGEGDAQSSAFK